MSQLMAERLQSAQSAIPNHDEWAKQSLDHWMRLARAHDTHGLPVDLIYIHCETKDDLPQVFQGGEFRSVTAEEFEAGIKDCVTILQAGGWESVSARLQSQLKI